jgi:LysM repeat protein
MYTVRRRDTLWDIARTFNVEVVRIKRFNKKRTSRIYPGEVLLIPRP